MHATFWLMYFKVIGRRTGQEMASAVRGAITQSTSDQICVSISKLLKKKCCNNAGFLSSIGFSITHRRPTHRRWRLRAVHQGTHLQKRPEPPSRGSIRSKAVMTSIPTAKKVTKTHSVSVSKKQICMDLAVFILVGDCREYSRLVKGRVKATKEWSLW